MNDLDIEKLSQIYFTKKNSPKSINKQDDQVSNILCRVLLYFLKGRWIKTIIFLLYLRKIKIINITHMGVSEQVRRSLIRDITNIETY